MKLFSVKLCMPQPQPTQPVHFEIYSFHFRHKDGSHSNDIIEIQDFFSTNFMSKYDRALKSNFSRKIWYIKCNIWLKKYLL